MNVKTALFVAFMALALALSGNITTYKITQDRLNDFHALQEDGCRRQQENRRFIEQNRETVRALATVAIAVVRETDPQTPRTRAFIKIFEASVAEPPIPPVECP